MTHSHEPPANPGPSEQTKHTAERVPGPGDPPGGDVKTDAPVSEYTQAQTAARTPNLQESPRALYRARLLQMWSAAHRQAKEVQGERERFLKAMERLGAVMPVGRESGAPVGRESGVPAAAAAGPLEGDVGTVSLLVADRVRRESDPQALVAFLGRTLSPSIARLESERQGTPEEHVDIVMRVLFRLRGVPATADLVVALLAYLQNQPPGQRSFGYYVTVANLAIVASAAADRRSDEEVFLYHVVLTGVRTLALRDSLEQFSADAAASTVSTSAYNLAAEVIQRAVAAGTDDRRAVKRVGEDIKLISACTTDTLAVDAEAAGAVVAALGFRTERSPQEFLAVVLDLGSGAALWQETQIGIARLEAASGVAHLLAGPERAASRILNAGISLLRSGADRSSEQIVLSRMLLNALGLRLALHAQPDLATALMAPGGLTCAVNFVGAFVEHRANADPGLEAALEPFVGQLVDLSRWPPLRVSSDTEVQLARLTAAGERLGHSADETVASLPDFESRLEGALTALAGVLGAPRAQGDLILDSAGLVGHVFTQVVAPTGEPVDLEERIDGIVASRTQPVRVLIERYEEYASPGLGLELGKGPLVVAGLLSEQEWSQLTARMLRPLPSLVPALTAFVEAQG